VTVAAGTVGKYGERVRRGNIYSFLPDSPKSPKPPKHMGVWPQYCPTMAKGGEVGCQPNIPSGASGTSGICNKHTFLHPTRRPQHAHQFGHGVCHQPQSADYISVAVQVTACCISAVINRSTHDHTSKPTNHRNNHHASYLATHQP
jgi:hypothetical protein